MVPPPAVDLPPVIVAYLINQYPQASQTFIRREILALEKLGGSRERKIDHVHPPFGTNSAMVAMLVPVMGGPPYSFTSHGPEEYDKPEALSLPEKVRRSKFVVAISEFGVSQLYRWCRYADWPKVKLVRCGVDEMFLQAAASTNGHLPPPPAD